MLNESILKIYLKQGAISMYYYVKPISKNLNRDKPKTIFTRNLPDNFL